MSRFLAVLLAAFGCVFLYLVATGIALPQAATARAMFVVSSVALLLSATATAVAVVAATRIGAQRTELQNLARSVDAALHDLASRNVQAHVLEAAGGPATPIEGAAGRRPDTDRRPIEITAARPRPGVPPVEREPAGRSEPAVAGVAVRLRPLLSAATGSVAGFDVLAARPDGEGGAAGNPAALERGLVLGAIEAASRPGFAGERASLHVSISQALLADRAALAAVVEALRRLNGAARSIVMSLPTELMENPAQHAAALARLAAGGPRLAADGWPGSERGIEALWRSGVSFLRLPAARLLAHDDGAPPGTASMIQMLAASGMTAIAAGVQGESAAAELAGLGVALMTPAVAHGPARAKSGNGSGAGDVIHI